jgi:septum site-determining protein MinD
MRTLTFSVSKGGVGKSLLTANVGAAVAKRKKKVVLVEGDPNKPLQAILGMESIRQGVKLDDVVKRDLEIEKAVYPTEYKNLYVVPSGVSLERYLEVDPMLFARKLLSVDADFVFVDVPFPLGKAAFLSLGVCEYFIMILTENEFNLCVESAIDTKRIGKYFFKCVPLGFVLNRIETPERFTSKLVTDLENLLRVPCIARIMEDRKVLKSYGGAKSHKAFLAYHKIRENGFKENIDKIAAKLVGRLPEPEKKDVPRLLEKAMKPLRL